MVIEASVLGFQTNVTNAVTAFPGAENMTEMAKAVRAIMAIHEPIETVIAAMQTLQPLAQALTVVQAENVNGPAAGGKAPTKTKEL